MKTCTKCGESKPLEEYSPDKRLAYGRTSRCKACKRVDSRMYQAANVEKIRAERKAFRALNREILNARCVAWREKNGAYYRAYLESYRADNQDSLRVKAKAYHIANPQISQAGAQRRIALKSANVVNLVSPKEWAAITAKPCAACSAPGPSTVDHIIPVTRGGAHTIGNLMPLCKPCNSSKHTMLWFEWKNSKRLQARKVFAA